MAEFLAKGNDKINVVSLRLADDQLVKNINRKICKRYFFSRVYKLLIFLMKIINNFYE